MDDTVNRLVDISRRKPTERDLVCPDCGGNIELRMGVYVCVTSASVYRRLMDLKAVERDPK